MSEETHENSPSEESKSENARPQNFSRPRSIVMTDVRELNRELFEPRPVASNISQVASSNLISNNKEFIIR